MRLRVFISLFVAGLLLSLTALGSIAQDDAIITLEETGRIDDDNPFDRYTFDVTENGSYIVLDIVSADPEDPLDTVLYLLDEDNNILAVNDDRKDGEPGDLTSHIEFPQAEAGEYSVIATRYKDIEGTAEGDYALTVEILPPRDVSIAFDTSPEGLAAAGFPDLEPADTAQWTILAYYGADNNLEQDILEDLKEFEVAGGSTEDVRILMILDRHPEHSAASEDWSGARLYEVTQANPDDPTDGEALQISSEELAIFDGEIVDSGDGELFAQFLVWGISNYPAENYIVTIGSHGAGWRGISTDDSWPDGKTIISLPELREAFSLAQNTAGMDRMDMLITDACYMSSVEFHDVAADYFLYSLASPEVTVNPAHDMTLLTTQLQVLASGGSIANEANTEQSFSDVIDTEDIEADAQAEDIDETAGILGEQLSQKYIGEDILTVPGTLPAFLTSAITDLSRFGEVTDAVNAFAAYVREDPVNRGAVLGLSRANAYFYPGQSDGSDLVDLGSLMRGVIDNLDPVRDAEYINLAQNVTDALGEAVRYADGGDLVSARVSTYHNIYFPEKSNEFDIAYFSDSELIEWGAMLRDYFNSQTRQVWDLDESTFSFHEPVTPRLTFTSRLPEQGVISTQTGLNLNTEIISRNIAVGNWTFDYIREDGTVQRLAERRIARPIRDENGNTVRINDWQPGLKETTITWDGKVVQLSDGETTNFELVVLETDTAFIDGRYRQPGSETWNNVTLIFGRDDGGDTSRGRYQQARATNPETGATAVVEIPVGSEFQALNYTVGDNGRVIETPGNIYTFNPDTLFWEETPAPSGEYQIVLTLTTFSGEETTTQIDITVDNEGVNPELNAYTSQGLGFIYAYPQSWAFPDFAAAPTGNPIFITDAPEESDVYQNFVVYPVINADLTPDDLQVALDTIVENYDLQIDDEIGINEVTLPLAGEGVQFDYFVTDSDGDLLRGRAFGQYYNVSGNSTRWLFFAAETDDTPEVLDEIYDTLQSTLQRFDPSEIAARDTGIWRYDNTVANTTHPVRDDWTLNIDDPWLRWQPEDGDGITYFASQTFPVNPNDPVEEILDEVYGAYVEEFLSDVEFLGENLTLTGQYHTWHTLIYSATYEDTAVRGRVYITMENQQAYAIWFQTTDDEAGLETIATILEPKVDGYEIDDVPLEELGVRANVPNLGPENTFADDDAEPGALLRYDGRSLVILNRLPNFNINISQLTFVTTDENGDLINFYQASDFVEGDLNNVRPAARDCYQLYAQGYLLPVAEDYPAEICTSRQAWARVRNTFWTSDTPGQTFQVRRGNDLIATCLTVRPTAPENYSVDNPNNIQRECLIDIPN